MESQSDQLLFMKKRASGRNTSFHELTALWIRQNGECALCGDKLVFDKTTHIDHIVPRKSDGKDNIENYQFVCDKCNYAKRALSTRDFIIMCIKISAKHKYTIPKIEVMGILSKLWKKEDEEIRKKYREDYLKELKKINAEVGV